MGLKACLHKTKFESYATILGRTTQLEKVLIVSYDPNSVVRLTNFGSHDIKNILCVCKHPFGEKRSDRIFKMK
jgi:hypothetical protein